MSKIQLKPCLFCGEIPTIRPIVYGHGNNGEFTALYQIECETCEIGFTRESKFVLEDGQPKFIRNGYDEVVSLWNDRAE